MSRFAAMPFLDVFTDRTGGNSKVLSSEYLAAGKYPIVDQGKSLIAGYSDEEELLAKALVPVIIFGDHTRIVKYVDHPFILGADGTKVLVPKIEADAKYLFHYLRSVDIPSAGYSRHYKFLKEISVPLPPLEEQRRIAAILDKADHIRAQRRQALAHLDALTQSIFHTMFDGQSTKITLGELCNNGFRNGISPSTRGSVQQKVLTLSAVTGSAFDPAAVKTSTFDKAIPDNNRVSKRLLLICRGNGNRSLVGKGYFPRVDIEEVGFPDTVIAAEPDLGVVDTLYLETAWALPVVRGQIGAASKTTNGTFKINQTNLSAIELPLPPLALQQTFATRVAAVERLKEHHRVQLAELDILFAALQDRAFKGEL